MWIDTPSIFTHVEVFGCLHSLMTELRNQFGWFIKGLPLCALNEHIEKIIIQVFGDGDRV